MSHNYKLSPQPPHTEFIIAYIIMPQYIYKNNNKTKPQNNSDYYNKISMLSVIYEFNSIQKL